MLVNRLNDSWDENNSNSFKLILFAIHCDYQALIYIISN